MDLYLLNTVMNALWYVFTILFLLYRFTTFFTYLYNFTRFIGKLFTGLSYLSNNILSYIRKKNGYIQVNTEEEDEENIGLLINDEPPQKTFYQITKNYIKESYEYIKSKFIGKKYSTNTQLNELYEERISSTGFRNSEYKSNSSEYNIQRNSQNNSYNIDHNVTDSNFVNSQSNFISSSLDDQYNKQNYFESVSLYNFNNDNIDSEEEHVLHSSIFTESKYSYNKGVENPFYSLMNNPVNSNINMRSTTKNINNKNPYNVESSNMLFNSDFINQQLNRNNHYNKLKSSNLSKSLKNIKNDIQENIIEETLEESANKTQYTVENNAKLHDVELHEAELHEAELHDNKNSFYSFNSDNNFKRKKQYKENYRDTSSRFITDPYESQLSRNPYI